LCHFEGAEEVGCGGGRGIRRIKRDQKGIRKGSERDQKGIRKGSERIREDQRGSKRIKEDQRGSEKDQRNKREVRAGEDNEGEGRERKERKATFHILTESIEIGQLQGGGISIPGVVDHPQKGKRSIIADFLHPGGLPIDRLVIGHIEQQGNNRRRMLLDPLGVLLLPYRGKNRHPSCCHGNCSGLPDPGGGAGDDDSRVGRDGQLGVDRSEDEDRDQRGSEDGDEG